MKKVARILATVFMLIPILTVLNGCTDLFSSDDNTSKKVAVSNTNMTVDYNEYLGYTVRITGTAKNKTNREYSYVSVEFTIYDASGANIGSALDNMNHLSGGETWRFEAISIGSVNGVPASYKLVDIKAF